MSMENKEPIDLTFMAIVLFIIGYSYICHIEWVECNNIWGDYVKIERNWLPDYNSCITK